jgi:hypothetical protein
MYKKLFLLISGAVLFFSCEKNSASLDAYEGNEIDSVTIFLVNNTIDTLPINSAKYDFNDEKNNIIAKQYIYNSTLNKFERSHLFNVDIVDKKETLLYYRLNGDIDTSEYTFDYNNFLRSAKFTNNKNDQYHQTTYIYNSSRELYQSVTLRHNTVNGLFQSSKSTSTYFWENGNIKTVTSEDVDLISSEVTKSTTKYKYYPTLNPLNHHYYFGKFSLAFEKTGKSCRNFVSSIEYNDFNLNFEYNNDTANNKLIITESSSVSDSKFITEIYYTSY